MRRYKKSRSTFRIKNPSSSKSESSSGVHLPHELITEILLRLPVKSLLKSKCVSKSWRSLISSPEFIKSHFSLSSSREGQYSNHHQLLFTTSSPNPAIKCCFLNITLPEEPSANVVDVECPSLKPDAKFIRIVGIVNGLVCLAIRSKDLFLWNPILRKSKHLPSPNVVRPVDSNFSYGFGYDESKYDYKVVSVQCDRGAYNMVVKVYSLLADSWRRIEDCKVWFPLDHYGKYANGKIHWPAPEPGVIYNDGKIVTLDLVSEMFGVLQRPACLDADVDFDVWRFGVWGGRLFILRYLGEKMEFWMMDKGGVEESWSKVASFTCVDEHEHEHERKPKRILCVLRNGEIVVTGSELCLRVYHTKLHNEFRDIEVDGCNSNGGAFVYVESLVWPNESCL